MEYFHDVTPPPEVEGAEEGRWWSPEPQKLESKEEDEEENQYLVSLLTGEPEKENNSAESAQPRAKTVRSPISEGHQVPEKEPGKGERGPRGSPCSSGPPTKRKPRRRELRRKRAGGQHEEWETARHGAWLRDLLTDSSEGEPEDGYTRFEESVRWIAEMMGSRDREQCEPDTGEASGLWM